ncbi:hypothetical protein RCL_jg25052.t1 [Rhizophagus clarus]|uniref:Uncharacterized protein n=1 Tax=Rhizophagus clarus TaxID=94130 RepID=A0A8H3LSG3_9GLOM|nr:hypothetical protein RCL_jg25052.t1 [Rhizophagus clarus]
MSLNFISIDREKVPDSCTEVLLFVIFEKFTNENATKKFLEEAYKNIKDDILKIGASKGQEKKILNGRAIIRSFTSAEESEPRKCMICKKVIGQDIEFNEKYKVCHDCSRTSDTIMPVLMSFGLVLPPSKMEFASAFFAYQLFPSAMGEAPEVSYYQYTRMDPYKISFVEAKNFKEVMKELASSVVDVNTNT